MNKEQIVREYLSAKARERWADPEYRARQIAARKASWMTPERQEAHSKGQRKRWSKDDTK